MALFSMLCTLLDVCSILVLTITRSSGVIRDQLVSLALPTENKLLEAYHNGVKYFLNLQSLYFYRKKILEAYHNKAKHYSINL